jgi:hypothetical protein
MRAIGQVFAALAAGCISLSVNAQQARSILDADLGGTDRVLGRASIASRALPPRATDIQATTPAQRRAAVDAVWGPGFPPHVGLEIFDKFWGYVDAKFAAFQGVATVRKSPPA